jgi:hypothetical protein
MMSLEVIKPTYTNRRGEAIAATNYVVDRRSGFRHLCLVLDTDQILALLEERGIRNVDIANALGLPDSRIPEIKRKSRALKLDEGVKLVRAFGLELNQPVPPLPPAISRLIVRHLAEGLGAEPDEARLQELSEDIRAFSEFVADPKVRRSLDAAESFFQAMRLRRPKSEQAAAPRSDPHRAQ